MGSDDKDGDGEITSMQLGRQGLVLFPAMAFPSERAE